MDKFEISTTQKEHKIVYADGTSRIARLFISEGGSICEYNKRSKHFGHYLNTDNVVSIEPVKKKSDVEITRKFMQKVCKILEKSGLWSNILHDFRLLLALNDEQLNEYINCNWDECTKRSNDLGLICGRMAGLDNLKWSAKKGVKSINYRSWDKETMVAEFEKAIANKETYSSPRWYKGYDNSVSCKIWDGIMCAWYSEEYKNCGNGHYYLAIDATHAIFCEDD